MADSLWFFIALLIHGFEDFYVFAALILSATLLIFRWRREAAVLFFFTISATLALNFALKLFFAAPRPTDMLVEATNYAFPSTHAAISAAIAVSLWWSFGRTLRNPAAKSAAALFAAGFVVLVAASRLHLGVHVLPDVIAGVFVGSLTASVMHYWGSRVFGKRV